MKEELIQLSDQIDSIKVKAKNEEATKQSLILPFLKILGYDVFNPDEVEPEVSCDFTGKGDRIDYVIRKDGKHEILIECKDWRQSLGGHINQLRKYFVASDARFAILTNGIKYLFFSDHNKVNIMDEKPFYSLDMTNLSDRDINFLSGFSKEAFNTMQMLSISKDILFHDAILNNLKREFAQPSKEFVKLVTADFHHQKLQDSDYKKFAGIIKDCLEILKAEETSVIEENPTDSQGLIEDMGGFSNNEKQLVNTIKGWLAKYETDDFKIKVAKLSDGYIRFSYHNRWWNICRVKIRPNWEWEICIKICKDNHVDKSITREYMDFEHMMNVKEELEEQCEDIKSKFFQYRLEHNL